MKTNLFTAVLLLVGTSAMAQTPVNSQTQINETRDYVTGMLNRVSEVGAERFNRSKDYQVAGRALQQKITQALQDFRDSMSILSEGALAIQIDEYNRLVRDTSIAESEKVTRLDSMGSAITAQMGAAQATYRASLEALYRIEPAFIVTSARGVNDPEKMKFEFADGKSSRIKGDSCSDYKPFLVIASQKAISDLLSNSCKSKLCSSLLLADYTQFLSNVFNQLDREITIELADGLEFSLTGVKEVLTSTRPSSLFSSSNCSFYSGIYLANTPFRDLSTQLLLDSVQQVWSFQFGEKYQSLPNKI